MIIDESTSLELKKIIKNGDYESFISFVDNFNIDVSDHFYGKKESSCRPLIQFTMDNTFTNKNIHGRIKIADYLVKNGADLNDSRPYGSSVLYTLLCQHYYLKDTKVNYEVYLLTSTFALELVRQKSIDVNIKFQCLEQAIRIYYFHLDNNNPELVKISRQIVLELIQKGAKYLDNRKEYIDLIHELTSQN